MNKYDLVIVEWDEREFLEIVKTFTIGWVFRQGEDILTILSSVSEDGNYLTIEIPQKCVVKITVLLTAENCFLWEKIDAWTKT